MNKNETRIKVFQKIILDFFKNNRRDFPWRQTTDPYKILVSEVMLQQTQTSRVAQKYEKFIEQFPDFSALAAASLREVLSAWQGLGYNRRALYLKKTAETVVHAWGGILPTDPEKLIKLPGIGKATAHAISAFAFHKPVSFIETNIRTVFIYFFFRRRRHAVPDAELLPYIEKALNQQNPREWYYALMDYGVMLKEKYPHLNKKSAHYKKQSPFVGSNRQLRGKMLKLLLKRKNVSEKFLSSFLTSQKTSQKRPSSSRRYKTLRKGPTRQQRGGAPNLRDFRDLLQGDRR